MRNLNFILTTLSVLMASFAFSMDGDQAMNLFKRANQAYEAGDFATAAAVYDSIPSEFQSFEVHFNAGNAYFKLGDAARCMWHYEMASLLKPGNDDLENNKKVAQKLLTDKIEELPVMVTDRFVTRLSTGKSLNIISGIAVFLMALGSLFAIGAFYVKQRRAGYTLISVVLVALSLGLHFFASSLHQDGQAVSGIIRTDRAEVKTAPGGSENAFVLHAGTLVRIQRQQGEFREIRLANGHVGWLPAETIREVKP